MKPVHGSQQFLLTLLGSYFLDVSTPIPSGFFVRVLADFEMTETAARNAVSRVTRQGFLEQSRSGRSTYYRLTPLAQQRHQARLKQIVNFGSSTPEWDGRWTVVAFGVREDERQLRHRMRSTLRRLGFGVLYDGVWITPWRMTPSERAAVHEVGVDRLTILDDAHHVESLGAVSPAEAFPLTESREALESFVRHARDIVDAIEDDAVPPTMALRLRTEILRDWRDIGEVHPRLPKELLPQGWPLSAARQLFERTYDELSLAAEERLRFHLDMSTEGRTPAIRSLTTREVAKLGVTPLQKT